MATDRDMWNYFNMVTDENGKIIPKSVREANPEYQERRNLISGLDKSFGANSELLANIVRNEYYTPGAWRYYQQAFDNGYIVKNAKTGGFELTPEGSKSVNEETKSVFNAGGFLGTNVLDTNEDGKVDVKDITDKSADKTSETPEYQFEMPSEWQTIEDMANTTVKQGEPTLSPELVNEWEAKLETSYAPVREKVKKNMADYWASLFPQGGGSGKRAEANMAQLADFEQNKLNQSLGFAQSDLANKLATFVRAQQQLTDIGTMKANADQFKSGLDASNYWNQVNKDWNTTKYVTDTINSERMYNRQAELAKYLAEVGKPKQMDFGTSLLTGLAGGLGQAGGYAGMAQLLALLTPKTSIV
jgi:hypothetical protein